MDYVYKVEITVDEDKVIKENKHSLKTVYDFLDYYFDDECIKKEKDDNLITYYTNLPERNGELSASMILLCDTEVMPYVKSMIWHNTLLDNVEDVLQIFNINQAI